MTGPAENGGGAPIGAPALPRIPLSVLRQEDPDPLIDAIRNLLPQRSEEDQLRGEVRVMIGIGKELREIVVPVLASRPNREWQAKLKAAANGLVKDVENDDTGQVMLALLTGATELQLDLLEAYSGDLSRASLEEGATDEQILSAFLEVTAAAYPFPVKIGRALLSSPAVARYLRQLLLAVISSGSTSSSPPSTVGRRRGSKTS